MLGVSEALPLWGRRQRQWWPEPAFGVAWRCGSVRTGRTSQPHRRTHFLPPPPPPPPRSSTSTVASDQWKIQILPEKYRTFGHNIAVTGWRASRGSRPRGLFPRLNWGAPATPSKVLESMRSLRPLPLCPLTMCVVPATFPVSRCGWVATATDLQELYQSAGVKMNPQVFDTVCSTFPTAPLVQRSKPVPSRSLLRFGGAKYARFSEPFVRVLHCTVSKPLRSKRRCTSWSRAACPPSRSSACSSSSSERTAPLHHPPAPLSPCFNLLTAPAPFARGPCSWAANRRASRRSSTRPYATRLHRTRIAIQVVPARRRTRATAASIGHSLPQCTFLHAHPRPKACFRVNTAQLCPVSPSPRLPVSPSPPLPFLWGSSKLTMCSWGGA